MRSNLDLLRSSSRSQALLRDLKSLCCVCNVALQCFLPRVAYATGSATLRTSIFVLRYSQSGVKEGQCRNNFQRHVIAYNELAASAQPLPP